MDTNTDGFKHFIAKIEEFDATHTKVLLSKRKALIHKLYKQLIYEFEEQELHSTYEEVNDGISIKITATSLITYDDGGKALNFLIGTSNISYIDVIDNHVVISLWFRCWEWIDKN